MKILHVIGSLAGRYGGPSSSLPPICSALADRGHDVEIWTTSIGTSGATVDFDDRVPVRMHRASPPAAYAMSWELLRRLRHGVGGFDVVHIHSLYLAHGAASAHAARRDGVPYLLRPHGTLAPELRRRFDAKRSAYEFLVERRNIRCAAAVHCTTASEESDVRRFERRARTVVIPLGLDADAFAEPRPRFSDLPHDAKVVAYIGRLAPVKGVDLLIAAFARVARTDPQAHLVVAGPDEDGLGASLGRLATELRVADRVVFSGFLAGDAKVGLLQTASVVVLPSERESMGMAALEAMATGTPVVVTPGVALASEVSTAGAGLVAQRDPAAIADAIDALLQRPSLAEACAVAGRTLVKARYDAPRIAAELEEAYRQVQAQ